MAGDDFRKKIQFFTQMGVCRGSRNLIIRGQRNTFCNFEAASRTQAAWPFGYVTAVEHNGKCKIRGRRSTFQGSRSLMAGDDIRTLNHKKNKPLAPAELAAVATACPTVAAARARERLAVHVAPEPSWRTGARIELS